MTLRRPLPGSSDPQGSIAALHRESLAQRGRNLHVAWSGDAPGFLNVPMTLLTGSSYFILLQLAFPLNLVEYRLRVIALGTTDATRTLEVALYNVNEDPGGVSCSRLPAASSAPMGFTATGRLRLPAAFPLRLEPGLYVVGVSVRATAGTNLQLDSSPAVIGASLANALPSAFALATATRNVDGPCVALLSQVGAQFL